MWYLVILLLSLVMHCNAQYDMASYFESLGCNKIELSQKEQACFINFTRNMMSAYGSLVNSVNSSMDGPNPSPNPNDAAVSIKAIMGVFQKLCENDVCLNGIKKTYAACKSYFQKIIKFDMVSTIELLCYKNSNGKFCVNDLPDFQGYAPPSCDNILTDQKCSIACAEELLNVSSTCCFPSMLAMFYSGSSPKEDYTQIWKSCKMSTPKLCDLSTSSSYPKNDDHDKTSDGVIFGYIAIILILSVIILFLMILVVKRKCKNRVSYDDNYTKVPFDIEDSDAI